MGIISRIINNLNILGNKDFNMIYDKDNKKLSLNINNNDLSLNISNGKLLIVCNGEVNIITNNHTLGLDSINSQLHLNGRVGEIFAGDLEAEKYRKRLLDQHKLFEQPGKCELCQESQD